MWPDMADSSRTCTHMANTQVMLGYYIQAIHLRPNRAGLSNQLSNQTRLSKQLSNQANNPGTPVESAVKGTNGARLPSCQASKAEATNTTNPGTPFKPAVKGKVTNRTRLPSCQVQDEKVQSLQHQVQQLQPVGTLQVILHRLHQVSGQENPRHHRRLPGRRRRGGGQPHPPQQRED